jgi:hypothetical protein
VIIALIALSQPAQAQVAVSRPAAAKLPPASAVLTKIAFGSCMKETRPIPALRGVVSGFTSAHRRHGGDGAFYVTLKRRG